MNPRAGAFAGAFALAVHLFAVPTGLEADGLSNELGRNETRILSGAFPISAGRTVSEIELAARLELRGYRRVRGRRPAAPGEYFWGHERFWIYRPRVVVGRQRHKPRLIGLLLHREDGRILRGIDKNEDPLAERHLWLGPTPIAESFDANRARTERVRFEDLPPLVWRAVLAAEDARFFTHSGLDARALARAALANARAGGVVQGGSTITQQLIKIRDLSPKRSLGRKASEALRALALEAEHDKEEILEAYLNSVYFGHLDGIHLYGLGTASRTFFSRPETELGLAEAALLAAMIQGPNRLSPVRNPDAVRERYRWVLDRLEELDWADSRAVTAARRELPELRLSPPDRSQAPHFLDWLESEVGEHAPKLARGDRGVVVHSTLDPLLQKAAVAAVADGLSALEASDPRLRHLPLSAALVALDGRSGDVLAYVGGDPRDRRDAFDRARRARRQPGSTVKPLTLLEAFQDCGARAPLYPARRISGRPLSLSLPSGDWRPQDPDGRFRDDVSIREATIRSLNVPFVRVARWCGFDSVARRLGRTGLQLPDDPAPAFVLGALETTPLELTMAYTPLIASGRRASVRAWTHISFPSGERLARRGEKRRKVASPATAYLVRQLLEEGLRRGPAAAGALEFRGAFGKTGTSSSRRDAWFAGGAGSVATVVWVGLDEGTLGLSGSRAAAPIWKTFMERAVPLRPAAETERPRKVIERWIQVKTGLLTSREREGTELELFRSGATPPKRRIWRRDRPIPPID